MDIFYRLVDGSLMPHGYCLLWRWDLLLLHIGGDIATCVAYIAIPMALVYLVRKREDLRFDKVFLMFALFILLCGISHMIAIINVWYGYYFLEGLAKLATGIVSLVTALAIWWLMPAAIAIPAKAELERKVRALESAEQHLAEVNHQLELKVAERTRQLEAQARTDALTGMFNRRAMTERLSDEIKRFNRYGTPFSILMIDLDDFKSVNDNHGHLAGDRVLQHCAKILAGLCRSTDSVCRFGGEEFLVLLPNTEQADAEIQAQRCCAAMCAPTNTVHDQVIRVSCSIGVAQQSPDDDKTSLLRSADRALYQAKLDGKNCVRVFRKQA